MHEEEKNATNDKRGKGRKLNCLRSLYLTSISTNNGNDRTKANGIERLEQLIQKQLAQHK